MKYEFSPEVVYSAAIVAAARHRMMRHPAGRLGSRV
jgi:hypothetical protein